MGTENKKILSIRILGKDYQVACPEAEEASLQKAVQYLDGKMRDIRNSGKIVGMERIAVMAALNIAHELMGVSEEKADYIHEMSTRIRSLQTQVEAFSDATKRPLQDLAWEEG